MSSTLITGDIIQLGNGGPSMDAYGVATWLPYTGAEFKVLAGEGQCDTGEHSSKRNKRKSGERGGGSEN